MISQMAMTMHWTAPSWTKTRYVLVILPKSAIWRVNCSYQFQLMDYLEPTMAQGGNIVEYHCCDFFPERWFSAVFVVRCNNTLLYDRLEQRQYNPNKLRQNIECEIFGEVLSDAEESYPKDIVFELKGESEEDFQASVEQVKNFVANWK